MQPLSQPATPPSCSDCTSKTQPAGGGESTQSQSRMWRSSSGNTRVDTPHTSVISLPGNLQTILLDHLKKEAMVIPMMPAAGSHGSPAGGGAPGNAPPASPLKVEDLGKSMIEGHEVEGKRYTLPPPPAFQKPKLPEMPKMPKLPNVKMPQAKAPEIKPEPPKPPQPPQPTVTEVWTSTKLKTPVLTKITSSAGERTTYCKPTSAEEPPPSVFQIPPGYKLKTK